MKTLIRGVFFAALLMCFGCSEITDVMPKIEQETKFDVALAKEAFVRDYTAAVEARSETTRAQSQIYYTLADTDYTPLWDKATTAENEHVWSIDVPLYSVSGAFASDTDGENMRMATQKLVFTKSKKDNNVYSYLLTLCPDVACAEKYSDLNDVFTHLGDCSKFSGLAIYTSLAGELVAVDKFVNGVETGYVYVGNPEADQHALHHQAEHLMEGMKFYLSSGPVEMTRGGGMDFIHEMLCGWCLKYPCECPDREYCGECGRPIAKGGEYGIIYCECTNRTFRCMWCGQELPEGKECNCQEEPFKECPDCHNFTCTCNPCPHCGGLTCSGCGGSNNTTTPSNPSPPSDPTDPDEPERCPYCDNYCEGHCEAYCEDCKQLKTDCTEHRCSSCNELYNDCTCK